MNKYSYLHDPKKTTRHINDIDATDFILNCCLQTQNNRQIIVYVKTKLLMCHRTYGHASADCNGSN